MSRAKTIDDANTALAVARGVDAKAAALSDLIDAANRELARVVGVPVAGTSKSAAQFIVWADVAGYDTANTYDTERGEWVFLNPMTADLWRAWTAGRNRFKAVILASIE